VNKGSRGNKMKSLTKKIQDDERRKEMAGAHTEALKLNERFDLFCDLNKRTRDFLISGVEGGSIIPGECMFVKYKVGSPAYGVRKFARGKIVDIAYNGDGEVVLRTGFLGLRRKHIPLEDLRAVEYQPEIKEAEIKKQKEKREVEYRVNKKGRVEKSRAYNRAKKMGQRLFDYVNDWTGRKTELGLSVYRQPLKISTARAIIENICKNNNWEYVNTHGRGPMTGLGCGDIYCAGAFNSGGALVGGIGIYDYIEHPNVVSSFRSGFRQVTPSLSCLSSIENSDLRKFISGFYAGLYGDKIGGKNGS